MIPHPGRAEQRFWRRWLGPLPASGQFRSGGVDDAHRVIGEVRGFDHPGPRAGLEGGEDVLAVLLVLARPGSQAGLVTAATRAAVRASNRPASTAGGACRPPGAIPAAWSSTASCSR